MRRNRIFIYNLYNPSPAIAGAPFYTREPFLSPLDQILKRFRRKILRVFVLVAPISASAQDDRLVV